MIFLSALLNLYKAYELDAILLIGASAIGIQKNGICASSIKKYLVLPINLFFSLQFFIYFLSV